MGRGLEVITGFATAPSSTFTAATMATGDSLSIRSAPIDEAHKVELLSAWQFNNAKGQFRLRSARLHDVAQGIRVRTDATQATPRVPLTQWSQSLYPQDTLILEITGSAVAGQIETVSFLVYYHDLPGIAARLTTPAIVDKFGKNLMGQDVPVTPGVGGGYTGAVTIVSSVDNTKANTDYALLGAIVDTDCATVGVKGIDTGNLRLGIPGSQIITDQTSRWFEWLSDINGVGLIPVINSANKNATNVDVAQNQAGTAVNVTLLMVELDPRWVGAAAGTRPAPMQT